MQNKVKTRIKRINQGNLIGFFEIMLEVTDAENELGVGTYIQRTLIR